MFGCRADEKLAAGLKFLGCEVAKRGCSLLRVGANNNAMLEVHAEIYARQTCTSSEK